MAPPIDHLKLIIQRFDAYIIASNTKSAFLLAFNTFICGSIISANKSLLHLVNERHQHFIAVILALGFICGIICLFFVMRAMYPYMTSGNSSANRYHSLIFFRSVTEFSSADSYVKKLKEENEDAFWEDLAKQIYQVSKGLRQKYKYVGYATTCVYIQLSFMLLTITLILIENL
ncbi:Pycsar system effector family protein [Sphingobacterium paludis]|uniref:Pycsar effector protein domain-containing protein n=1 Tax=Sphingobacterium paludis TaxID=1476465 RepID=A0A4R7D3R0_9SPHI|nr:hypothetical protein B0I21_103454 [Sphingobacterium paludis]